MRRCSSCRRYPEAPGSGTVKASRPPAPSLASGGAGPAPRRPSSAARLQTRSSASCTSRTPPGGVGGASAAAAVLSTAAAAARPASHPAGVPELRGCGGGCCCAAACASMARAAAKIRLRLLCCSARRNILYTSIYNNRQSGLRARRGEIVGPVISPPCLGQRLAKCVFLYHGDTLERRRLRGSDDLRVVLNGRLV
jgi:hypothetical protein